MLELKDLKDGEIYYLNLDVSANPIWIQKWKSSGIEINKSKKYESEWNTFGEGNFYNKIRLATDEEKAWLEYCIKEDKFVEYEEFMKVYKPQFIVGQWYKYNNHIGKFYSYDDDIFQVSEYIHKKKYYNSHSNWGNKNKDTERSLATIEEIQEFLPQDHPDKQLDIKQIQEECKRRFPIGCKYISANGSKKQYILIQDETVYEINDSYIYASDNQGCLYYKGKYAELIETPEVIIPEYVECLKNYGNHKIGEIFKTIGKQNGLTWKECLILHKNLNVYYKASTKSAYDLQNLKQQPLTPEQCYNTEIEVGDEVEVAYPCSTSGNKKGYTGYVKSIFQGGLNDFGSCQVYEINGWCEHISALKLIKKANKNTTTTTLNKKVDVSSPKVTDRLKLKVRNQTTVVNTEERIKLKLNHLKTIKIKQHVN